MSYGFLAVNQSNITQIDGTYDNIAVLSMGTANSSYQNSSNAGGSFTKVYLPTGFSDVLVFLKPSVESGAHILFVDYGTDSNGTWYTFSTPLGSTSTISVDYKFCVRSNEIPASPNNGYGLKVYKSNGDEAFSSNNINYKVRQVAYDTTAGTTHDVYAPTGGVTTSGCFRFMNNAGAISFFPSGDGVTRIIVFYAQRFDYPNNKIESTTTYGRRVGGNYSSAGSNQVKTNTTGTFI